jgi:rhodanese-related sulfurtransferase
MVGEIEPATLRERLDADGAPLLVDIRGPEAFAEGHLPDSENVPMADLPQHIDAIADADHVVTICPHGKASVKAARIVEAYRDFDGRVDSLAGGLEAWDGPLAADSSEATEAATDEGPEAPF